jgi:hypothetical protein
MNRMTYGQLIDWHCGWPHCGMQGPANVEIHHVVPFRIGGPNKGWNYWALCHRHHRLAEWGLTTRRQFDLKAQAELAILGGTIDERTHTGYRFIKSRGVKAFRHLKGDDIHEGKAARFGLKAREIQIGGCSLLLVERTYQAIDSVLKRTDKARALKLLG